MSDDGADARREQDHPNEQAQTLQGETPTHVAGALAHAAAAHQRQERTVVASASHQQHVEVGADARPVNAGDILKWAAQLVRAVADPALARDLDAEVAEPVRRIALQMRDAAYAVQDARRVALVEPLEQLIAEMHTMSDGIDNADNHTDYQVRLLALGLTTREFLRRHRAVEAQRIAAPPEVTLEDVADEIDKSLAWIDRAAFMVDYSQIGRGAGGLASVVERSTAMHALLFVRKALRAAAGVHPPQDQR